MSASVSVGSLCESPRPIYSLVHTGHRLRAGGRHAAQARPVQKTLPRITRFGQEVFGRPVPDPHVRILKTRVAGGPMLFLFLLGLLFVAGPRAAPPPAAPKAAAVADELT